MHYLPNALPKWYAIYTRSRAEKKLHTLLTHKNVECFLPLKKTLKQRSDRKKWVEEPLLHSYLFVRISKPEYYDVLNTPGAVCYVSFEGKPAPIKDSQILALKNFLRNNGHSIEITQEDLAYGDLMEVTYGPMKGARGEVLQIRGSHRIVLRFEALGLCVHTEISLRDVKRVDKSN